MLESYELIPNMELRSVDTGKLYTLIAIYVDGSAIIRETESPRRRWSTNIAGIAKRLEPVT